MIEKSLIFFIFFEVVLGKNLLMIQETFRHGARYPIFIEKADGSDFAQKQNSIGQLTNQGKNMHYFLGKIIYQKYWDQLFKDTVYFNQYNQSQFYVKSTDVNRTIESAQSHLFGLLEHLPPLQLTSNDYQHSLPAWNGPEAENEENQTGRWKIFETGPKFHPTPIHVDRRVQDFLRAYDTQNCPEQYSWKQQNWKSEEVTKYINHKGVQSARKALSQQIGRDVPVEQIYKWKDTQTCQQYLGLPYLPVFDDPTHKKYFEFIEAMSMYVELYVQPDQIRTVATPYFQQTLQNLKAKANGTYTPKIVIYSAHDTTVGMILAALNMTNLNCIANYYLNDVQNQDTCVPKFPIYTSNVIFELWENNGKHTIKILYNGEERKIPICDYLYECPLSKFQEWVQGFVVKSYSLQCGIIEENSKSNKVAVFILMAIIIVLVLAIVYMKWRQIKSEEEKKNDQGYEVQLDEKVQDNDNVIK